MLPTMPFGRTGHDSTRVIFGAAALGGMRQERADAVLAQLLEAGVNHLDTAASYGDAELRMGPWMAEHRDRFFLATKTGEREGTAARAELERSLERLRVDSVDLIQLHNLVEPEEWEIAFAPGGAVEALARAQEEGLVRHLGVTGHGTRIAGMHLRSLERYPFASVLLPFSYVALQDPGYRADVEALLFFILVPIVVISIIASALFDSDEGQKLMIPIVNEDEGGGGPDDQVGRSSPVAGRPPRAPVQLVRAAAGPGRGQPRRPVGPGSRAGVPQHLQRRPPPPRDPRRGRRGRPPAARCGAAGRPPCARRRGALRRRRSRAHLTRRPRPRQRGG